MSEKETRFSPKGGYSVRAIREPGADSRDDFPSPPWAVRALWHHALGGVKLGRVWEPACGRGDMARALKPYCSRLMATDKHDYGDTKIVDFVRELEAVNVDWIITNPPFKLAEQFIMRALEIANVGVAMLVRSTFFEGKGRYERIFLHRPPSDIWQFVERVPMLKGRLDKKATTATAYSWAVWRVADRSGATLYNWIPPCRSALERDDDYKLYEGKS